MIYFFVFFFGAIVGSFLNVCIWRLPRNESIVFPASRCPSCGTAIRWYDNIPILGWVMLRGRCRSCRASISLRYPLVEALNGALTLVLFLKFVPADPARISGLSLFIFAVLFVYCCAMVVITFIDLDHQIIPDVISLPGIVLGFIVSFFIPGFGWQKSLLGILLGGGILLLVAYGYEFLTKKEGMGGGDVKLLAMMGAFFGWKAVPFILFFSSLLGSVIGITVMVLQKKDRKLAIPFGPFLAGASILYIFFGREIIRWYLSIGAPPGG